MNKETESEGKIIDESEFTPADFDQSEREIDDTAIVAFEHPKRTRARNAKIQREAVRKEKEAEAEMIREHPFTYIEPPHHVNSKHHKIALGYARRKMIRGNK